MRPRQAALLLCIAAGIFAFHAVRFQRWVSLDRQPPAWDASVHLSTAQDYRDAWQEGRWLDLILAKPRPGRPAYPPLYHYTLAPLLSADHPHLAAVWLNLGYLMLLVLGAGWIAWELGGLWPAAAAMVLIGFSAGVANLHLQAFTDLAAASWVTAAYAALLSSRFYARPGPSLGVGLCAGLALLSKWNCAFLLLPAWLSGWRERDRRRNLWRATAVAAAAALPWYLVNSVQLLPRLWTAAAAGTGRGTPEVWSWASWRFYLAFWADCFSWPALLLLAAGAAAALWWSRQSPRLPRGLKPWLAWSEPALPRALVPAGRAWVAAWLAVSWAVMALVPTKDGRYILPATAAVPALGAAGLPGPALAAAAGLSLARSASRFSPPDPGDWRADGILDEVSRRRDRSRPLADLCLLADHAALNSDTYRWLARHRGLSEISIACEQSDIPEWADFVLVKTADAGVFMSERSLGIARQALAGGGLFARAFREQRRWPLPDGSQAVLFQARPDLPGLKAARFAFLQIKTARLEDARLQPRADASYEVSAATVALGKLGAPVHGVRLRLEGARLLESGGRVYVLGLRRLALEAAQLRWDELSRALSGRSGLPVSVGAEGGAVAARVGRGMLSIEALLRLSAQGEVLAVRLERLRVLGLPVPGAGRFSWQRSLAPRKPYQPYAIGLAPIHVDAQGLRLGAP